MMIENNYLVFTGRLRVGLTSSSTEILSSKELETDKGLQLEKLRQLAVLRRRWACLLFKDNNGSKCCCFRCDHGIEKSSFEIDTDIDSIVEAAVNKSLVH